MRKNDWTGQRLRDLGVAFALLTRLPLPHVQEQAFARQAKTVWAFPIVGVVVALLAAGAGISALWLGLPATVAAGVVLVVQILVTGAMHEDGLADTADGLWGGWTRERRLEIMKDSAIGTYGVLALVLVVGLRWSALTTLIPLGFGPVVAAAVLSRAVLPVLMTNLPHARDGGLSHSVGAPRRGPSLASVLLGLVIGTVAVGSMTWLAALCTAVAAAVVARLAMSRIGGQTGDILGATQQSAELAVLLSLAAAMPA